MTCDKVMPRGVACALRGVACMHRGVLGAPRADSGTVLGLTPMRASILSGPTMGVQGGGGAAPGRPIASIGKEASPKLGPAPDLGNAGVRLPISPSSELSPSVLEEPYRLHCERRNSCECSDELTGDVSSQLTCPGSCDGLRCSCGGPGRAAGDCAGGGGRSADWMRGASVPSRTLRRASAKLSRKSELNASSRGRLPGSWLAPVGLLCKSWRCPGIRSGAFCRSSHAAIDAARGTDTTRGLGIANGLPGVSAHRLAAAPEPSPRSVPSPAALPPQPPKP